MTDAKQVRARLHRLVCQSARWSDDCRQDGGRHEKETWPLPEVRALISDATGAAMHARLCSLHLDRARSCPDPESHARIIYAVMTKEDDR